VAFDYHLGGGGAKPSGWAICLCVDHPGHWWTESFMESLAFIGDSLSDVRVIMTIMHVFMEEWSCQAMTG
jgi:hypothetical protein